VEVALVHEAGGRRDRGDRLARLEQAARGTNAVCDLQRVRREPGPFAEHADQAELAHTGDRGEFVEADVAVRAVGQVVGCQAQGAVIAGGER